MKSKNIIVAFLLISTLVSCNSDNESGIEPQPVTTVLVKNIKHTYTPNDIEISTLKYDGNKIISRSTDGGFIATYTYTGNVITKIEERVNDKFQRSYDYIYLNGKVAKEIQKDNLETDSRTYTYNANGTVSYVRTRTGGESTTGLLTFENGNLVKNEEFYGGQYPSTSTYIFGYDTKNNPFKNLLGFNLLFDTNEDMYSKNNMTQDGSGGSGTIDTRTFKYDEKGYPTECKYSYGEVIEYFY